MTYKDLKALLKKLTDNQLEDDVTIFDEASDEYLAIGAIELKIAEKGDDVLDVGHIFLAI